ncbi:hypothetical protein ABPG74_007525 [Tetrahymena malaccensis]
MNIKVSRNIFLAAILVCLFAGSYCESLLKNKVIVVVDSSSYQHTHSTFFNDLRSKGYDLDFRALNSATIKLLTYGEYNYDQMIVIASSNMDGKGLTKNKIAEFFDSGRNVFIATDIDSSKTIRQLYNEFGVDIDEYSSRVQDHFNKDSDQDHSYIQSKNLIKQEVFCPQLDKPILYRGAGLSMTPYETYQVYGVLRGEDTIYSYSQERQESVNTGSQVILVSATQGRNNARAVLTGSIEMLSNEFFKNEKYANRQFVNNIIDWNFGLNGILKVGKITYTRKGEKENSNEYRIKDFLDYSIEIFTYSQKKNTWVPYITDDIVLEFIMLDPYIRQTLTREGKTQVYKTSFQIPDKHGIFKLKVKYQKPGFTFIEESNKVTVRPFKHNEYPRYLEQAYPYYFSTWATLIGFLVLVVYFLFHQDKETTVSKKND